LPLGNRRYTSAAISFLRINAVLLLLSCVKLRACRILLRVASRWGGAETWPDLEFFVVPSTMHAGGSISFHHVPGAAVSYGGSFCTIFIRTLLDGERVCGGVRSSKGSGLYWNAELVTWCSVHHRM
jgi:hypothetical protein